MSHNYDGRKDKDEVANEMSRKQERVRSTVRIRVVRVSVQLNDLENTAFSQKDDFLTTCERPM
jgi:hypothetical protein